MLSLCKRNSSLLVMTSALLLTLLLFASPTVLSGVWDGEEIGYVAGFALLKTTSDSGWIAVSDLREEYEVSLARYIPRWRMYLIEFPPEYSVFDVCADFEDDDNVVYCEPDVLLELLSDDPHWNDQWNFHNTGQGDGTPGADIMLEEAHAITQGSESIKIAILDSGIPATGSNPPVLTHPDLPAAACAAHAPRTAADSADSLS